MTVIDDYLTTVEPSKRKELERIRALAKQTVPGAGEAISRGVRHRVSLRPDDLVANDPAISLKCQNYAFGPEEQIFRRGTITVVTGVRIPEVEPERTG